MAKLATKEKLERDIEKSFKWQLDQLGLTQLKLNVQGSTGWPDRLVLLPSGRAVFIELKRAKSGKVSPKQQWVHKQLRELGHAVGVFYSADEAVDFVRSCKFGLLRAL